MADRSHLSIGEVLNLLQDEFPDITISKIRFLESQGLLDPERTPSGYRKFYEGDIERLRWILRQQKENFLPLKVIKDRLASGELDDPTPVAAASASSPDPEPTEPADQPADQPAAPDAPTLDLPEPTKPRRAAATTRRSRAEARGPVQDPLVPTLGGDPPSLLDNGETGVALTADEILGVTGLSAHDLTELERFGLLESRTLGNTSYYDDDALVVAKLAAGFMAHGVEARHLRMYKVSAEREAGVFEQLVMPLLKQRNPGARTQATERLDELATLGGRLRSAMLRQALREHLGS